MDNNVISISRGREIRLEKQKNENIRVLKKIKEKRDIVLDFIRECEFECEDCDKACIMMVRDLNNYLIKQKL